MAQEKNAQVIFQGSQSGAAIVVGNFEEGKTIHWNMGGHYAGTYKATTRSVVASISYCYAVGFIF